MRRAGFAFLFGLGLCACDADKGAPPEILPEYLGVRVVKMDDTLVNVFVSMGNVHAPADIDAYTRCAAAAYTLTRGYGFARHVRTNVTRTGGVWRGDAVYTISPTLPEGLRTIDAEMEVRDCAARGIPTV